MGRLEARDVTGCAAVAGAGTEGILEEFAVESHRRAARATDEGRFTGQIAPLNGLDRDEGIRPDANVERMSTLPPLREGYEITAAVSSQVSVGAAALLVVALHAGISASSTAADVPRVTTAEYR